MTVSKAASNAVAPAAKGDLVIGSGTNASTVLGVGTNNHVLTADSAVTGGIKWAAPAAGGALKFISRTSFSNVASQAFDDVFTSTYAVYMVQVEVINAATSSDDFELQFRYAGPTTQTANYYGTSLYLQDGTNTVANNNVNGAAAFTISPSIANPSFCNFYFYGVGDASRKPGFTFDFLDIGNGDHSTGAGLTDVSRIYTGFLLKSSSSNITGTVAIYGIATS